MATTPFTIDFTNPGAPTAMAVAGAVQTFDPAGQPSSVNITWNAVSTAPELIDSIEIWTIDAYDQKRIAKFTDPAVTSFLYHHPRLNINVQYQIHQIVKVAGGGTQVGLWANTSLTLPYRCLILVSTLNPVSKRVSFEAFRDFAEGLTQSQEWQIPAGGQDYFEVAGSLRGRDMPISVEIFDRIDGSGITALQEKLALEALFDSIPPETMSLRHPRGGKWFGRFNGNWNIPYVYGGGRYQASGGFRRTTFKEGN